MRKGRKRFIITLIIVAVIAVLGFASYQLFRLPDLLRSTKDNSLGETEVNALVEQIREKDNVKVLVAYYSYSGTTRATAQRIQEYTSADLFEITRQEEYENVYLGSNSEIRKGTRPPMGSNVQDITQYDVVFVGYPVWWHATPPVINTFIESNDLKGKLVIPFCTSSETDIEDTMKTFLDSCDGLAVYGARRFASGEDVKSWIDELNIIKK